MLPRILLLTLCACAVATFAADEVTPGEAAREAAKSAYDVTIKDMKPEDWKKFVKKMNDHFETWAADNNSNDRKDFLDNQLICIAPSVKSGEIKALKKFMSCMALYHLYNEPVPWYIRDLAFEHHTEFKELFTDFSWEKASQKIKNKTREYEKNPEKSKAFKKKWEERQ